MNSSVALAASPPLRILVIDDDKNTLTTISRLLRAHGHDVTDTPDGQNGVELARQLRPDVVLCDVNMPGLDGYGVLRALKNDPRTAVIPFIFLSGAQDHDYVRQGMGLGADDYLTKPFEPRELFDSIRARIERQRAVTRKLEDLRVNLALSVPSEFFTPLNAVLGFSMLTLETLRSGAEVNRDDVEDAMESIHQAGEQLLRIASNYVLFAQLSTEENTPAAPAPPQAHDEWQPRLARAVRQLATRHGRLKDLHYSFSTATLALKPEHLDKLVLELLDNAFKFSRSGQSVSVTGIERGGRYELHFTDQGCGMTPEQIETLGPMIQIDRMRTVQSGIGLGLAICRLLVARYSGTLALQPNVERGLVVDVTLPIAPTPEPAAASPHP